MGEEAAQNGKSVSRLTREAARERNLLRSVRCPWCMVAIGRPCVLAGTDRPLNSGVHPSRRELAKQRSSAAPL